MKKQNSSNFTTEEQAEVTQFIDGTPVNNGLLNTNPFENDRSKISVSEAITKLQQESQELFKDKENTAKTTIVPEANNNDTAKIIDNTTQEMDRLSIVENRIMGMKPLTFAFVAVGVAVATYYVVKHYKTKKPLMPL